jgi:hypothetical protein
VHLEWRTEEEIAKWVSLQKRCIDASRQIQGCTQTEKRHQYPVMLSNFWSFLQLSLYPALEECLKEPLSDKERQLVALLEFMAIEQYVDAGATGCCGRPKHERCRLIRAFVVKTFYGLDTNKALHDMLVSGPGLRLICGYSNPWQVPSLSTFSRAFSEFANAGLGDKCHKALVRHHVGKVLVLHNSRDSTAVPAREKPVKKAAKPRVRVNATDIQYGRTTEELLAALPRTCGVGRKPNSQGNMHTWIGYKLHVDWLDGMIPANVETTSASVHDAIVAIPMMRTTADIVPHIAYQLMDSAYDAGAIRQTALDLGQTALIEGQTWRKKYVPFDPAEQKRFCHRTNAERGFARLKDEFGLCKFRVRGYRKVHLHAMISILLLFADQMLRPIVQ